MHNKRNERFAQMKATKQTSSTPSKRKNSPKSSQIKPKSSKTNIDSTPSIFKPFLTHLEANSNINELSEIIKTLDNIAYADVRMALESADARQNALFFKHTISMLREKLFAFFSNGGICDVSFINLALFIPRYSLESADSSHTQDMQDIKIPQDMRFEPFITLAKQSLFAPDSSDSENILLIELYITAKLLRDFANFNALMQEYISLVLLLDINLPQALEHTDFIVRRFDDLGIDIEVLFLALKAQLAPKMYFSYPLFRRRSVLNWQLHCFWNVASYFNHHLWLSLYDTYKALFYEMLQSTSIEGIDEAMYMQFFMYHMCGTNFHHQEQWANFCADIDKRAVSAYEHFAKAQGIYGYKHTESKLDSKKVIGILRDRLVPNSPYKVELSLLYNVLNDADFKERYEIRIYTMKLIEKSSDEKLVIEHYESIGVKVIDVVSALNTKGFYNSHLQKALAIKTAMNADNVAILISPNNGYGISDFILASRSAPLQIYYSHGNFVYDVPSIDKRMTHICQNKLDITIEGFKFHGVPVKMLDRFYNPALSVEAREQIGIIKSTLPLNAIILGSIGRLIKMQSKEYWQCVISIMQTHKDCIYLACGGGNSSIISQCILACFEDKSEGEAFLKRIYFVGYIDSAIYGHIIDIWLDTFPLEHGESRIEFVAKGGLSLVLSKLSQEAQEAHILSIITKWSKITESSQEDIEALYADIKAHYFRLVAFSNDDYIAKGKDLVALFSTKNTKMLNDLKHSTATLRQINDDIRLSEGVRAFKGIVG